jgi:hypothetical protein
MAEQIRCPYCILGELSRPMLQRPNWFICEQCGHIVLLEDPNFRCSCDNCVKMNRAA